MVDHTVIGQNLTAEQWCRGILCVIGEQLGCEAEPADFAQSAQRLRGPETVPIHGLAVRQRGLPRYLLGQRTNRL